MDKGYENRAETERLISLIGARDLDAASRLYDRYAAVLYGWILSKTNDVSMAEEVLSRTFLSIWNNSYSFDAANWRPLIWMIQLSNKELGLYSKS